MQIRQPCEQLQGREQSAQCRLRMCAQRPAESFFIACPQPGTTASRRRSLPGSASEVQEEMATSHLSQRVARCPRKVKPREVESISEKTDALPEAGCELVSEESDFDSRSEDVDRRSQCSSRLWFLGISSSDLSRNRLEICSEDVPRGTAVACQVPSFAQVSELCPSPKRT